MIHSARRDNTRATELACSFPFNQKCSDCKISEPFDVNKKRGRNLTGCKFQGRRHWEMREIAIRENRRYIVCFNEKSHIHCYQKIRPKVREIIDSISSC